MRAAPVATLLSLALALAEAPRAAGIELETTRIGGSATVLRVSGRIEAGDAARLERALGRQTVDEVWFNSLGGRELVGYAMGRVLRREGVISRVPRGARCASACVDAFLGAPIRFVDAPYSVFIHPASASGVRAAQDKVRKGAEGGEAGAREVIMYFERVGAESTARWINYVLEMGASARLVEVASEIPHDCAVALSRQEMLAYNIVNTGGAPKKPFTPEGRTVGSCE